MTMDHTISILALLAALACIFLSYFSFKKHHYLYAILLIMLSGLILRILLSSDFYLHAWDERYHALVAKNLLNHPLTPTLYDKPVFNYDHTDWTQNHIWLHKQPLALWLMALSMKFLGVNEIALRLPSIILSTLAILLTYYIGYLIFNRKVGLLASFFQATNLFIIQLASGNFPTDHVDTIFQFLVELGIFLSIIYTRKENNKIILLLGITAGLAVLTKWLPGLIIFPVFVTLLYTKDHWKTIINKLLFVGIICLTVFIPWQIYIHFYYPNEASWEGIYNFKHIFEALEGNDGTIFFYIKGLGTLFSPFIYISLTYFLLRVYRQKDPYLLGMAVWLLIPYIFFSLVATKMPAYIVISAPIIFIAQALFWCDLKEINLKIEINKFRNILLALIIILPIIQTSYTLLKMIREDRNPKWVMERKSLNEKIGEGQCVVFNDIHYIETMFYSSYSAYPFIPSNDQINQLTEKGYKIVIIDSGGIPLTIRENDNVTILTHDKPEGHSSSYQQSAIKHFINTLTMYYFTAFYRYGDD